MSFKVCLILIFAIASLHPSHGASLKANPERSGAGLKASPERVQTIMTKTADCFQCGMIEGLGYLDVKVKIKC